MLQDLRGVLECSGAFETHCTQPSRPDSAVDSNAEATKDQWVEIGQMKKKSKEQERSERRRNKRGCRMKLVLGREAYQPPNENAQAWRSHYAQSRGGY